MERQGLSFWHRGLAWLLLALIGVSPLWAAETGPLSALTLQLQGLASARDRNEFETKLLKADASITRFTLTRLTAESSEYLILTRKSPQALSLSLLAENPSFGFELVSQEGSLTVAKAQRQRSYRPQALPGTAPSKQWEKQVKEALGEAEADKASTWLPSYKELEPNSNLLQPNLLEASRVVEGKLSNRADVDVYVLEVSAAKVLYIDILMLGKTFLRPMARLYGPDWQTLELWPLSGRSPLNNLTYKFAGDPPERLYLRIYDQVGLMMGETGGSRFYDYLLRYRGRDQ